MWSGSKDRDYPKVKKYVSDFDTYHEPFLGGGAVYFRLLQDRGSFKAFCSDINTDLITTYQEIKNNSERLIELLPPDKDRATFNLLMASAPSDPTEQAARFLYLNRNRFFGMGGWMNADRYARRSVVDRIRYFSPLMQQTSFTASGCRTFPIESGSFVFCDPPYPDTNAAACYRNEAADIMELNRSFYAELVQSSASFLWITKFSDEFDQHAKSYDGITVEKKEWSFRKPGKAVQLAHETYASRTIEKIN